MHGHICDKFCDVTDDLRVVSSAVTDRGAPKTSVAGLATGDAGRLSPLVRGVMEAVLQRFGVEATVDASGSIYDEEFEEPLGDLAHIAQAFAHADVVLEAITHQRSTFGAKALEGFANLGGLYGTKSFYDEARKTFVDDGWFTMHLVLSALEAAARIIAQEQENANRIKRT